MFSLINAPLAWKAQLAIKKFDVDFDKILIYFIFTEKSFPSFLFFIKTTLVHADGSGFGDRLGTVYPEDPYFKSHSIRMDCPRQKTFGTYKKGKTYKSTFNIFYNSNYFWAYRVSRKNLKILIGFKDKEKNIFRIDGFEKGLKKKYENSYFSILKNIDKVSVKNIFTDINDNSKIIEIKLISSSGKSKYDKLCSLRWQFFNSSIRGKKMKLQKYLSLWMSSKHLRVLNIEL